MPVKFVPTPPNREMCCEFIWEVRLVNASIVQIMQFRSGLFEVGADSSAKIPALAHCNFADHRRDPAPGVGRRIDSAGSESNRCCHLSKPATSRRRVRVPLGPGATGAGCRLNVLRLADRLENRFAIAANDLATRTDGLTTRGSSRFDPPAIGTSGKMQIAAAISRLPETKRPSGKPDSGLNEGRRDAGRPGRVD